MKRNLLLPLVTLVVLVVSLLFYFNQSTSKNNSKNEVSGLIFDTPDFYNNNLINEDPDFAEAWNKRATVYFMMGDFDKSMQDIIKTLELEPRHFGALDGMGLIFIHQGQYQQAIDVYDKMLEIFPFSLKTMEKRENIMSFISQST